jgi:hypothetical protein
VSGAHCSAPDARDNRNPTPTTIKSEPIWRSAIAGGAVAPRHPLRSPMDIPNGEHSFPGNLENLLAFGRFHIDLLCLPGHSL